MKTMNYLFLMTMLIISSSCTNYSPFGDNGSEEELADFYLELDFHQGALKYEDEQLQILILAIQEELQSGNDERQELFEQIQARRSTIEEFIAWNDELLFIGPIGPGGRPPRCDISPFEPGSVFKPCPVPRKAFDNFYVSPVQFPEGKGNMEFLDENDELVGRLQGTTEVPDSDGTFVKVEVEFDSERATAVRITKFDFRGEPEITKYPLE